MKSLEIRKKFFEYFKKFGHEQVMSSSLIPAEDPTLLFTNAGMNQFKDCFLGKEKRSYNKAVTIQKCVRAGGKHNDLDNVGFTKRHLTFFEMMGNFSFGDYFKKDAIPYAWNFLTQDLGIDKNELFVSVYEEDDEAFEIWEKAVGIPKERIYRFGKKDNFWQMGDTGPCGPCTEIFVDTRPQSERTVAPTQADFDSGALLEVWNTVFMQYDRQEDGTLVPLKQTGVDTGMGLERITCVMQNVDNVYETDLFAATLASIEALTGITYKTATPAIKAAFNVLADHVRSSSLIIADGGSPSNEGRGYVLRKIIRRAALFAQKLSDKNIFPEVARAFIQDMSSIYPELGVNEKIIISLLTNEIEQFSNNLIRGQAILQTYLEEQAATKIINGQQAFKLYDTYGFPLEVTMLAAQEHGFTVDIEGFHAYMEDQRKLSGKKMKDATKNIQLPEDMQTTFVGYQKIAQESNVIGLLVDDQLQESVNEGTECWVITKETPFFASTGGQVDDQGWITSKDATAAIHGLKKIDKAIAAKIIAPTVITTGDIVAQQVDEPIRKMTMNNHTATHLLQAALIEMLGKQVKQSGSVVEPEYLRFDFTYHKNLTIDEITHIENRVNEIIQADITLHVFETNYKDALEKGVIAIFGEKYNPEKVRVVDVPGFSAELCGGTHVPSTGVIGAFKITDMGALSAGNRRIFAVTGPKALELMQDNFNTVKVLSQEFKVKPQEVLQAVTRQTEQLQQANVTIRTLKKELLVYQAQAWHNDIEIINNVPFLYKQCNGLSGDELKDAADYLQKTKPGLYVMTSNISDTASVFFVSVAPQHEQVIDLKVLSDWLQKTAGLRGGGKKGTLQGGGPRITQDLGTSIKAGLQK